MADSKNNLEAIPAEHAVERLRAILATAVEGIITIDDRGTIETLNPSAERLFGYSANELIGRNVKVLMPSPYYEGHDGYLANYRETRERKIIGIGRDVVGKRKDGTEFPLELAVSEFKFADQRMFAGFIRDLTERQRSEEIELSLGRIVENSLNEIFIFDAETLKFVRVNRGARENIGYSMEQLRELTLVDIKPNVTEEQFLEIIQPLKTGKEQSLVFETVHARKDGSRYPVEVHLQMDRFQGQACFVAIILDITERKQFVTALQDSEERYRALVETSSEMVQSITADGRILFVNRTWVTTMGYSEDEVSELNLFSMIHPDSISHCQAQFSRVMAGETVTNIAATFVAKDGRCIPVEGKVTPVIIDGRVVKTHGFFRDVTDRKKAEEAIALLNNELEQRVEERTKQLEEAQHELVVKDRLAILGHLAGGVAHEIRNPLGVIKNAVYYLQQREQGQTDVDEDASDALKEISRGLNNSERIVSELLDYARGPTAELSRFPMDEALGAALDMVSIPRNVVVAGPGPSEIYVDADRGQIERLLANLIQNATQAMPNGGSLTLRCTAVDGRVVTEVSDTGNGIAEAELERIFEPLFTKRARGIGLGLPLCRRYAAQHNGTLEVKSEFGKGSTFTLTLPLESTHGATQ